MDEHRIRDAVYAAKAQFGPRCAKLAGSVTVEVLRHALQDAGMATSARDVFVQGVEVELDLLIARPGAIAEHGLVYQPSDVRAVLEVKHSGLYSYQDRDRIREAFTKVQQANPTVRCAYVTLSEGLRFKGAMTDDHCGEGQRAFTLFWHRGEGDRRVFEATGQWSGLLEFLRSATGVGHGPAQR